MSDPLVRASLLLLLLVGKDVTVSQSVHESEPQSTASYAGSDSCQDCHEEIYNSWRSTRHSFSILTALEARRAGYPLPKPAATGTGPLRIAGWDDVLFTVGGRKRIAYVDTAGMVQGTSFHPRLGAWSSFPAKPMECAPCHHTGFDPARSNPRTPQIRGSWAELNIGCEACHGPAGKHMESYDKADIEVDISSRLCGTCHTLIGRVLPKDDTFHATHDNVQVWNRDRHATGVKFNSHDGFCARCHSPYDGEFLDLRKAAAKLVLAEEKRNITCISCHDPHAVTHTTYNRRKAYLKAPLPTRFHLFKGHDGDVTTNDFFEFERGNETCVQCHAGADRIDLNHADAGCTDCHNPFNYNRGPETRVLRDANRQALNCRPCHVDGDHLLTLLLQDPDALQPKYVHNLLTLPQALVAKYQFRYPKQARPVSLTAQSVSSVAPPKSVVAEHQQAVVDKPETIDRYFDQAAASMKRNNPAAALEILERALGQEPDALLISDVLNPGGSSAFVSRLATLFAPLLTVPEKPELGFWIAGYLNLRGERLADAEVAFAQAVKINPDNLNLRPYLALSRLAQHKTDAAITDLQTVLKKNPAHSASRLFLGVAYLEKRQFASARKELEQVIELEAENAVAPYFLGLGHLRQRDLGKAVKAFRLCLSRDPDYLDAYFALGRAYRLLGDAGEAINAYRALIARKPDHLEGHWELANLLKYFADAAAFQIQTIREGSHAYPADATRLDFLDSLAQQERIYREQALSEFLLVLSLRPSYLPAIRQVGELHRRSGRLGEAREVFAWLARIQPNEWVHLYRLGTILIQQGRYREAIETIQKAIALAPTEGDCYSSLGLAYVKSGRFAEAISAFETGAVYQPFNPALYINLGAAYASQGEYETARKHLGRAIELGTFPLPRLYLAYTNLGLIDLQQRKHLDAVRSFKHALHIFPDYSPAREALAQARGQMKTEVSGRPRPEGFVFHDLLEIFGEVTTAVF